MQKYFYVGRSFIGCKNLRSLVDPDGIGRRFFVGEIFVVKSSALFTGKPRKRRAPVFDRFPLRIWVLADSQAVVSFIFLTPSVFLMIFGKVFSIINWMEGVKGAFTKITRIVETPASV